MSGNSGWSVGRGRISAISLVCLFVLASMVPLLGATTEVSADPAARHRLRRVRVRDGRAAARVDGVSVGNGILGRKPNKRM